ncbi:MAG: DUF934 domain-containing protein [Caulobacteraceae bacterium]
MPTLIRWRGASAEDVVDGFTHVADDADVPSGDLIVSLSRFQRDGERLLAEVRRVGVRVAAGEAVEALAYDLPRLALVALEFPRFKDGRAYSAAMILRSRLGWAGEVRAVGDVLREQAGFLVRAGFDAFEPADSSRAADWNHVARRFRHVYQRAADTRPPAFAERRAA